MLKFHLAIGGCVVIAAGTFLVAGPLNPPTGPVSAGGRTTQEIYDAVTNISGSIGSVGGRGPAVPGGSRGQGTFAVTSGGGQSFSGPMLGLRLSTKRPMSGGVPAGRVFVESCTIVRELSDGSASAFRIGMTNQAISAATAVVPSVGGNTVYQFTGASIYGNRHFNVQRSDGTFAAMEEIDLAFVTLTLTDPAGRSFTYDFSNTP